MITFTEPVFKASPKASPLDPTERRVARAIREAVAQVQASTSTRAIAAALDAGDIGQAVELVRIDLGEDFLLSVLPADLRGAYEIAGGIASKETGRMLRAGYSFNLINPRSVEWVRQNSASLIRQWGESSRDGIRRLITAHFEALRGGSVTAATLARQIKNTGIGLTWRSARAVLNQRQRWQAQGVAADVVDARAERYFNRLLKDRAEMIARTEMTRAMTQARLESWRQATDRGLLDPLGYEKEWVVTRDARACDDCKDLDGARASIPDGVFIGDGGTNGGTGPGYHPRCRCTVIVVPNGSKKIPRAGVNIPGDLGIQKYNPNHAPAGSPEGGQFTSGDGGGAGGESADPLSVADQTYPKTQAGAKVGGLTVRGGPVENTSSIEGEVLPGVRVVQMSAVRGPEGWGGYRGYGYAAADDVAKVERLIEAIRVSGEISPLIVSISADGPYVLEGGHRASALAALGITEFPALVALEDDADLTKGIRKYNPHHVPAGSPEGGQFASADGGGGGGGASSDTFERDVIGVKVDEHRLNLPMALGVKAGSCSGFGKCTQNALKEHAKRGTPVYVGTVVRKERYDEALAAYTKDGTWLPSEAFPHAWNVSADGIIDRSLGSDYGSEHIYFGVKVPESVLATTTTGDELARWHVSHLKA